jgi:pimeloyl-ACP methyl ester carboxylesterase
VSFRWSENTAVPETDSDRGDVMPHAPASVAKPSAVLARHTVTAPDGLVLSVLVATPGRGIEPATGVPPVLALHGFASSAHSGWGRTGHLDTLTRAGRTVVALDLRGHGESAKPHDVAVYTLEAVLADIAVVVAEIPRLLAGFAVAPGSGAAGAAGADGSAGTGMTPPAAGAVDVIGYSLGSRLSWTVASRSGVPVRRMVLGGFDGRPLFEGATEERLHRLAAGVAGNDTVALAALVQGLAGTGAADDDGPAPSIPTLIVAGDRDPLANRAEQFAAGLPTGEFLSIPGRNHISTVPARDYRNRLVEFLSAQ